MFHSYVGNEKEKTVKIHLTFLADLFLALRGRYGGLTRTRKQPGSHMDQGHVRRLSVCSFPHILVLAFASSRGVIDAFVCNVYIVHM